MFSIKKINSFDSPEKSNKKYYCLCPAAKEIEYSCQSGQTWINNCFKTYNYEWNLEAYEALIQISSNIEIVSEETETQIKKDLFRTFQKIDLFASKNMKEKLMRILKWLVAYDPCNGYTQGMNFIAAALILLYSYWKYIPYSTLSSPEKTTNILPNSWGD